MMLHKLEYCGQDGWIEFDCLAPPYGSIGTKVRARHTYKQDRSTPSRIENLMTEQRDRVLIPQVIPQNVTIGVSIQQNNSQLLFCYPTIIPKIYTEIISVVTNLKSVIYSSLTVSNESAPRSWNLEEPQTSVPSASASCFLTISQTWSTVSFLAWSSAYFTAPQQKRSLATRL